MQNNCREISSLFYKLAEESNELDKYINQLNNRIMQLEYEDKKNKKLKRVLKDILNEDEELL